LGLLGGNIEAAYVALLKLMAQNAKHVRVDLDEVIGRLDLASERSFLNCRRNYVRA
jgi:hypothetical protein